MADAQPDLTAGGLLPDPGMAAPVRAARGRGGLAAFSTIVAGLFAIPIVAVLVNLALPSAGSWPHLVHTLLAEYVINTLWLALGVGLGVVIVGTGTAWLVTMCSFPGARIFDWALVLPLAVPAYVMAYAYTDFLQVSGPVQTLIRDATGLSPRDYWFPEVRSLPGAVAMLVFVLYPYVYLLARAAFLDQSVCVLEIARTLGCSAWGSFRRVAVPAARPAIVAGTALALMETLADYGTVAFFGVPTFTTGIIRTWISLGDRVAAAQLSAILLAFVFVTLIMERWSRSRPRFHHTSGRYRALPSYRLRGAKAGLAWLCCFMPLCLGFLLPATILLASGLNVHGYILNPTYLRLIANSFSLGGITAMIAVVLALLMASSVRLHPSSWALAANRIAGMGYAMPGIVLAVGILVPSALLDNAIGGWMRAMFGISTGLLLVGTLPTLIYAYLVRFLAVALNTVEASLAKINPSMGFAARVLGRSSLRALLAVHIPILRGGLLTAALLIFVDVVKELPATLMMRPFNFDTLAVQAYQYASDERLAEASIPSLAIVAVGVLPLILLSRTIARSRPGHVPSAG